MENNKDILNKLRFEHIKILSLIFKDLDEMEKEILHATYVPYHFGFEYNIQFIGLKTRKYNILFIIKNEEIIDLFHVNLNDEIKFLNIENTLILQIKNIVTSFMIYFKYNLNNISHKEFVDFIDINNFYFERTK